MPLTELVPIAMLKLYTGLKPLTFKTSEPAEEGLETEMVRGDES